MTENISRGALAAGLDDDEPVASAMRLIWATADDAFPTKASRTSGRRRYNGKAMSPIHYSPFSWERMIHAVEKVRARLERAVAALEKAGIPYAVAGGNAVAAWVSRVDDAAVLKTLTFCCGARIWNARNRRSPLRALSFDM